MSAVGLGIRNLLAKVIMIFPDDPWAKYLASLTAPDWLRYLNYFVPVTFMVEITKGWCLAIVVFRVVKFVIKHGKGFFDTVTGNDDMTM